MPAANVTGWLRQAERGQQRRHGQPDGEQRQDRDGQPVQAGRQPAARVTALARCAEYEWKFAAPPTAKNTGITCITQVTVHQPGVDSESPTVIVWLV